MCGPVAALDAGQRLGHRQILQAPEYPPPIQLHGFKLVRKTHQTLVARGLAIRFAICAVLAEVASFEGLARDDCHRA